MNSRQRVLTTVSHREPDRVPLGEWGIDHDHVSRIIGHHTFWRNRKDSTLAYWDNRRDEVVESMKKDCVELVDAMEYDIVTVELVPPKNFVTKDPPRPIDDGVWEDRRGNVYKYAASNDSIMCMTPEEGKFELTDAELDQLLENADKIDDSEYELIDYLADHYGDTKAFVCRSIDVCDSLLAPFKGDYNHKLILTLDSPDELKKMYPVILKHCNAILDHIQKKGVSIGMQGYDFGMNTGCIISPDSIRDIFFPIMKMVNDQIVAHGMIPFYHCCGRCWDIMDDYVAAGYRGYQSIQESAGMDTRLVKERYGRDLTLWTGVQCETLVSGTLQQTEDEVRRNLEFLMPGGGFIFGSTNSVQYGAKTENYLRAVELLRKYGNY